MGHRWRGAGRNSDHAAAVGKVWQRVLRNALHGMLAVVTGSMAWSGAGAQSAGVPTAQAKLPTYDVSTVRLNTKGLRGVDVDWQDQVLSIKNQPLKQLLQEAFEVQPGMIFGLPDWADKARYDIEAKVLDGDMARLHRMTQEEHDAMLRELVTRRFGLKTHFESRTVSALELVLAKGGPKFPASTASEEQASWRRMNTDLEAKGVQMSKLIAMLAQQMQRPVVDRTGLQGRYDLTLKWSRDRTTSAADAGQPPDAPPTLLTALPEQLGLRLQAGKDPVQVLVVDAISPPTEN